MASSYPSKAEHNFICFAKTCVEFIKLPLRDILINQIKPEELYKEIKLCDTLLTGKRKLCPNQHKMCFFPPPILPDYNKFDVTLLYTLIRNLCPSVKPTQGWGVEPKAKDTKIGDDIERLRLFRNSYAHGSSAEISDTEFDDIWKNVKSIIQRVQIFLQDFDIYEPELKELENCRFGYGDREKYMQLLEATLHLWNQTENMDDPNILIKCTGDVICGNTAYIKVELKQSELKNWSLTWRRIRGKTTEQIDTSREKYICSTNEQLTINSVCKDDEGNYQAVLSRSVNGKTHDILSNITHLEALGASESPRGHQKPI